MGWCYRIITEADILEISIVGRPAQPDARFTKISISLAALHRGTGGRFPRGTPINCDACLKPCVGVARPFE